MKKNILIIKLLTIYLSKNAKNISLFCFTYFKNQLNVEKANYFSIALNELMQN